MRSDVENPKSDHPDIQPIAGQYLTDAIGWFKKHEIELWGIQTNPEQFTWTHSPKAYAQMYIDDAALGCPLIHPDLEDGRRPYADWMKIRQHLKDKGLIKT